jgi:hypothetical protein
MTIGVPVPANATRGVSAVVMDSRSLHDWTDAEQAAFAIEMRFRGFRVVYDAERITVWQAVPSG